MKVDSIQNGIVIDHITAGRAHLICELLDVDRLGVPMVIMKNAASARMGRKDMVKIDSLIDINLDVIGYVDPEATVNYIRDGELVEKRSIGLPEKLVNVLQCKNPRCITTCEQELDQVFRLTDPEKKIYRCIYCETRAN